MDAQEYINLQAQIDRQTPERQSYLDIAAQATLDAEAMQPAIDAAQADVDAAQAALDAAIAAGEDPAPYQEALNAVNTELTNLQSEQSAFLNRADQATQQAATLEAAIQSCQALIDAEPPPTPAQQAAARAEWLAYLLLLRREAVANAVQQVPVLAADLPIALGHAGLRAFVLDATKDKFGDVVGGGGPNKVPVYSDGLVWRIG